MFMLTDEELQVLRSTRSTSNILRSKFSTKSRALPKAFTEKGLYMLATVLRSKKSIEVTFAIIETFVKVRKIKRELELNFIIGKIKHTVKRIRKNSNVQEFRN